MKTKPILLAVGAVGVLAVVTAGLWYWFSYGGRAAALAGSGDPEVRLQAVRMLSGKSNGLAVDTLSTLTGDSDANVALQATTALGLSEGEPARQALLKVIESGESGELRGEAAASLGMHGATDVHRLGEMLKDDVSVEARIGAARGIARLRRPEGLKYLVNVLKQDKDPRVQTMAIYAIQKILIVRFRFDVGADAATREKQARFIENALKQKGLI